MFWHKEAIFKLKGDKLSSSAECRIWTQGLWHQISSRLNACQQTDWAIEDQAKKKTLNSIAHPHREIIPTGLSEPRFHAPLHNFTPTPGPAGGGSVAHHWPRLQWAHSLAAFDVALIIWSQKFHSTFSWICNVLGMPILMSVSKSTQVLSKFYFHDTPEQDQRAWEQ